MRSAARVVGGSLIDGDQLYRRLSASFPREPRPSQAVRPPDPLPWCRSTLERHSDVLIDVVVNAVLREAAQPPGEFVLRNFEHPTDAVDPLVTPHVLPLLLHGDQPILLLELWVQRATTRGCCLNVLFEATTARTVSALGQKRDRVVHRDGAVGLD